MTIDELIASGRIEAVPVDPAARDRLVPAHAHRASAAEIVEIDPAGAYALAYDAARKAITAHMLAAGLRPRNRPGAHASVVLYAQAVLTDEGGAVRYLDRMRRTRNELEYGSTVATPAEARFAIETAGSILAAVSDTWPL